MTTREIPDCAGIIDSHFHLREMAARGMDAPGLLAACFAKGFRGGLDCAVGVEDFAERAALSEGFPGVFLAAGLYPSEAAGPWRNKLSLLEEQCRLPRVIAVGEAGIDLHRQPDTVEEQIELFRAEIAIAEAAGLPIVVHCRNAEREVLAALRETRPARGGVMHCYSGDYAWGKKFIDAGFHISFAGNLTFPKSSALREAAAKFPADRLLVETDSPYLAPQPVRGRPNHPGNAAFTYACLADLRKTPPRDLVYTVAGNFDRLFSLTPGGEG